MFSTEFLDLPPLAGVSGTVRLPGSKSISNRVLLLAALCEGATVVHDLLDSDDTRVMLAALAQLGCGIERPAQRPHTVIVTGLGTASGVAAPRSPASLFLGNAGTAMRPLAAALAVLGGDFTLHGVPRMHERPIGDLVQALRALGCAVDYSGTPGFPPLRIGHPQLRLEGPIGVRGDVSSQFLTALLLALPLAAAQQAITIEVQGELISRPYIDITLKMLAQFGIAVQGQDGARFVIPAGSRYRSPGVIHVEADASSASYFIAASLLSTCRSTSNGLTIEGLGSASIQGDIRFVEAAQQMGARIDSGPNWLRIQPPLAEPGAQADGGAKRPAPPSATADRAAQAITPQSQADAQTKNQTKSQNRPPPAAPCPPLQAIDLDCNHIPDAAMTLAVLALYARGTTTLRNIASWRVKETDRIAAMAAELRKLGATVQEGADFIRITPPATAAHWQAATIATYDDHRMAMCFSLAAFNPARLPVRILDPQCVAKTFPDYFETLLAVAQPQPGAVPVLCIDGPTASGKGTLASQLAARLGYHYLDSGALYRLVALAATRAGLALDAAHEPALAELARRLPVRFEGERILLATAPAGACTAAQTAAHAAGATGATGAWHPSGAEAVCATTTAAAATAEDVTDAIRTEEAGMNASRISALPAVRAALLDWQRGFARLPGLVADGRDMGTVIFPDAPLKVFLTASAAQRAERRHKQLISKGISAKLDSLRTDLEARDARDMTRASAPLKPAQDAVLLDNSSLDIEQSVQAVLDLWNRTQPFDAAQALPSAAPAG